MIFPCQDRTQVDFTMCVIAWDDSNFHKIMFSSTKDPSPCILYLTLTKYSQDQWTEVRFVGRIIES